VALLVFAVDARNSVSARNSPYSQTLNETIGGVVACRGARQAVLGALTVDPPPSSVSRVQDRLRTLTITTPNGKTVSLFLSLLGRQ
jgi:hypothetical protein